MELHSTGNTLPGTNKDVVCQQLQKHLKLKDNQARALVEQKLIIKRNLDEKQARLYCEKFKQLGLDVCIKETLARKKPLENKKPSISKEPSANKEPSTKQQAPEIAPFPVSLRDFETIFKEEIKHPKVSLSYQMGLLKVAFLSLLTPIVYLGITALTGWATIVYFLSAIGWASTINNIIGKLIVLSVPTLIGAIIFLFLIKPFFAKREEDWGFDLQREDAPALFNLIDVMCARIDIHAPKSIRIDNSINAAAGPENGIISLLRGNMRLYIGLPLLVGLNARQFVGVLAHEFGHFAQPSAMLTYQLINRVNHWLYDRAFIHDSWDERLERWLHSNYTPWILDISIMLAKLIIKVTRMVFKQMYLFNHRMSQSMSRQMEYDADSYESIVCGSHSFKQTSLQLRKLSLAAQKIHEINDQAWYENRLLRDYANAIGEQALILTTEELTLIKEQMHQSETNTWDSHPADTDRIAHVEQRNDAGFFKYEASAKYFCKDFDNLSERVTRYQYSAGKVVDVDKFISDNNEILQRHTKRTKSNQSLEVYFANTFNTNQMIQMDANTHLVDRDKEWKSDWQATIDSIRQQLPDLNNLKDEFDKNASTFCQQKVGRAFMEVGVNIEADDFGMGRNDIAHPELIQAIQTKREMIAKFESLFVKRIKYALQAAIETLEPNKLKEMQSNFIFINELSKLQKTVRSQYQLAWITNEIMGLCPEDGEIIGKLQDLLKNDIEMTLWENLNKQWNIASKLPDKVDNHSASLFDYVVSISGKRIDSFNNLATPDLVDKVYRVTEAICYQYTTVFAELVETCLEIEQENGIKPIKLA